MTGWHYLAFKYRCCGLRYLQNPESTLSETAIDGSVELCENRYEIDTRMCLFSCHFSKPLLPIAGKQRSIMEREYAERILFLASRS